uniref:Uncharacterized protein n=1 Tax=Trichobilharzia regenti TaxID=157069 RepID=A0AA85IQT0_TRIRE|nr:unnamed protein product [Trichobilharzia regenti]
MKMTFRNVLTASLVLLAAVNDVTSTNAEHAEEEIINFSSSKADSARRALADRLYTTGFMLGIISRTLWNLRNTYKFQQSSCYTPYSLCSRLSLVFDDYVDKAIKRPYLSREIPIFYYVLQNETIDGLCVAYKKERQENLDVTAAIQALKQSSKYIKSSNKYLEPFITAAKEFDKDNVIKQIYETVTNGDCWDKACSCYRKVYVKLQMLSQDLVVVWNEGLKLYKS